MRGARRKAKDKIIRSPKFWMRSGKRLLLIPLKEAGLKAYRFEERKFFVASNVKSSLNPSKGGKLLPLEDWRGELL